MTLMLNGSYTTHPFLRESKAQHGGDLLSTNKVFESHSAPLSHAPGAVVANDWRTSPLTIGAI